MRASRSEPPLPLSHTLAQVRRALRDAGIPEWRVEAETLLRHVTGVPRADFLAMVYGGEHTLDDAQQSRLQASVARRLDREPLAYITGRREFYGLDLEVNDHVLIPRQETELLVELAIERLAHRDSDGQPRPPTALDVGTGSGAIALALATHAEGARIVGIDISRRALDVAMSNRARLRAAPVEFILGDLLATIAGPIDLIVSNPPYIPTPMLDSLQIEVRREPSEALDGGADGLERFRTLTAQASGVIAPDGVLLVELMPEQMDAAMNIARQNMRNIAEMSVRKDLMGNSRALVIQAHGRRNAHTI